MSVDLKGSLKHCSQNGLHNNAAFSNLESVQGDVQWDSNAVEVMQAEAIPKPKYQQDLDQLRQDPDYDYDFKNNVETWTDFAYTRFHPRSITIVNEFEHSLIEDPFDCFTAGMELWKGDQFEYDFCDKIRQYIEECNNCQVSDCT